MTGVILRYNAGFEIALRKFTSALKKQEATKAVRKKRESTSSRKSKQ